MSLTEYISRIDSAATPKEVIDIQIEVQTIKHPHRRYLIVLLDAQLSLIKFKQIN